MPQPQPGTDPHIAPVPTDSGDLALMPHTQEQNSAIFRPELTLFYPVFCLYTPSKFTLSPQPSHVAEVN